ncbi:MAG: response regulator [Chthoniobacterales bacterium]
MYFPRRLLIIDEEPQLTALLRDAFAATGRYLIKEESRRARALHAARHFQPDLFLVGAILPELDGRELAEQLRHEPALRDVPIVFVTSLDAHGAIGSVGYLGGYSFVAKSFQLSDLITCVDEILADDDAEPVRKVA